jgi:hypothetical protein
MTDLTVSNEVSLPTSIPYSLNAGTLNSFTQAIPTFSISPSECSATVTYAITGAPCSCTYSNDGTCWLNCVPNASGFTIGTTSCSVAADEIPLTLEVTATDPVTTIVKTQSFSVVISIDKTTSITASSPPGAKTYLVGSTLPSFAAATYAPIAPCFGVSYSYSLDSITPISPTTTTPTDGSVNVTDTGSITINTSNATDSGSYTVAIKATETTSRVTDTQTFTLTV